MQADHISSRFRLIELYLALRASFWFVPLICVVLAMAASLAALRFDESELASQVVRWLSLPAASVEGARQILSTIAGSIITVAALVLSLTFVALTMMSQQFGPRILTVYMKDTQTQIVIGLFIGSFLYSLFVLGAVGTGHSQDFVPHFSLYVGCLLAVLSFLAIIYFVHHVAVSIQADSVVAKLGSDLDKAIESAWLEPCDSEPESRNDDDSNAAPKPDAGLITVSAECSGYVQMIEHERALELMEESACRCWYECRPGHFVIEGLPIAYLQCADGDEGVKDITSKLAKTVHLGEKRTQAQFGEFELNALVEVALRALSTGINDAYTAIACINELTDALSRLMRRHAPATVWRDPNGVARVMAYPQTFAHFLDSAFHPIRHAARGNTQVIIHLADALQKLTDAARNEAQLAALRHHAEALLDDCRDSITNQVDRERVCEPLMAIRGQA